MALKVVKNSYAKEETVSTDATYIIQVKNQKGEIGYVGNHLGNIFVFKDICSEVIKYGSIKEAKLVANKISNVQTRILGKEKIGKILAEQTSIDVTVPIEDIKEELYCVCVMDINTDEKLGYLCYKPELKEYYLKPNKDGIAFWEGSEQTDGFIKSASSLIAAHKNLKLEKELLNSNSN